MIIIIMIWCIRITVEMIFLVSNRNKLRLSDLNLYSFGGNFAFFFLFYKRWSNQALSFCRALFSDVPEA